MFLKWLRPKPETRIEYVVEPHMGRRQLDKIMAHADRLVILSQGRVVCDGRPEDILPLVEQFGVRQPDASRLGAAFRSWLN